MVRVVGVFGLMALLDVLKGLGVKGRPVTHFAYGANLDPAVMERRRIPVRSRRAAELEGFRLTFESAAPHQGAGFASVTEAAGERVLGAILEIDRIDALRLHCFEQHYVLRKHVLGWRGDAFYYRARRPWAGLVPTRPYRDKIVRGLEGLGLGQAPETQALRALHPLDDPTRRWDLHLVVDRYDALGPAARPVLRAYDQAACWVYYRAWGVMHGD
ncbi:MAG: gamma-glutamylcyclotransferase [Myxococcales bacterium]|nr:MAG: gamma-glutamylcyclotransferase [Myxococcales bacterium]